MMYYTDDPERDFLRRDAEQEDELSRLPVCDICGEPIYEHYYDLGGDRVCEECLNKNFRREVEDI